MDTPIIFRDRVEAGRELAKRLEAYADQPKVLVLGIPRGGVPVAFQVAVKLHAPLDVFIVRKLGTPGQEELAFGAIASGGIRFLDREIIDATGISESEMERITAKEEEELARREQAYRGKRKPLSIEGQVIILVDDGIATGSSMYAAIRAIRRMKPARIVVAVPVAPISTCRCLKSDADEIVCVQMPESFHAIGQFYEDFSQVTDGEVVALLQDGTSKSMHIAS
jgi:putative phosphoribosyl transferase